MTVQEMREAGYPLRIIGNDDYEATLVCYQPLLNSDYMGVYRYQSGDCCHNLDEIEKCFTTLEK